MSYTWILTTNMQKMIKMMALKQVGLNNYCIIEQIMVDQIKLNTV